MWGGDGWPDGCRLLEQGIVIGPHIAEVCPDHQANDFQYELVALGRTSVGITHPAGCGCETEANVPGWVVDMYQHNGDPAVLPVPLARFRVASRTALPDGSVRYVYSFLGQPHPPSYWGQG